VFGLDNRPQTKPHFRLRKPKPGARTQAAVSYAPPQVAEAYDFPASVTGAGQCIGIVELGGGYKGRLIWIRSSAISAWRRRKSHGASNSPTGDSSGPDGDVELEFEGAGSVAPGAQIAVYFAPNTDQDSSMPSRPPYVTRS
jgi:kumamolisin